MFVDGYERNAYREIGFGKFTDSITDDLKKIKLAAPELGGFGGWWRYLTNVAKLSPVEEVGKGGFPEGVAQLGGTFVVDGDEVVYEWRDRVPGDHPDLEQVVAIVEGK
jgi:hypothetical protein